MNPKLELTSKILEFLNLPNDADNVRKIIPAWWYNTRKKSKGGLRLTKEGFEAFKKADIKFYKVRLFEPLNINNQLLLWMDNYIDCPFFLKSEEIYVFSEKMAVQLMLFSGNIHKFTEARDLSQHH